MTSANKVYQLVVWLSPSEVSYTARQLLWLISSFPDHLTHLIEIRRYIPGAKDTYEMTWIGIFVIDGMQTGLIVAFVSPWSTDFGTESGGEGIWTYASVMTYLEERGLYNKFYSLPWAIIDPELAQKIDSNDIKEAAKAWRIFLSQFLERESYTLAQKEDFLCSAEALYNLSASLPGEKIQPSERWRKIVRLVKKGWAKKEQDDVKG